MIPKRTLAVNHADAMTFGSTTAGGDASAALPDLETAILHTVAYADVFDYPLTSAEIHRYLEVPASLPRVQHVISNGLTTSGRLGCRDGFASLPGREYIVEIRRQRAQRAQRLWRRALAYGRFLAALPFVRMVALTGSLAMDNADANSDLDYFLITAPERLWLCRALAIAVVRWAAQRGDSVCPNYFLSERALVIHDHNLFVARELAQMVPLHGPDVYRRLRRANTWSETFLPNADGPPPQAARLRVGDRAPALVRPLRGTAEVFLRTSMGAWLDRWEMERKIEKFHRRYPDQTEAAFAPDWCKGHFEGHSQRILAAFSERVHALDEAT